MLLSTTTSPLRSTTNDDSNSNTTAKSHQPCIRPDHKRPTRPSAGRLRAIDILGQMQPDAASRSRRPRLRLLPAREVDPRRPANGGDGGNGGSIYIQAVAGGDSLHKLSRRGVFKAGDGRNGQGKSRGGQRGEDVLIQVPIGTVVREISRVDPVSLEEEASVSPSPHHDKWILSPTATASDIEDERMPAPPKPRRTHLAAAQPQAPIYLDLSKPMDEPMLLVAGAAGGLGNPHFVTKDLYRPKYATKGGRGMRLEIELELKLLADLGLVGLPNAGKSTLLRALTSSRARIGNWAFTTLQPNIGTVVLDDNRGRAKLMHAFSDETGQRRTQFSIADIPGLVPDAHLDKGLGLDFLRHIERARVLAFVVDLSSKVDAVATLKLLWRELDEFEKLQNRETEDRIVNWQAFGSSPTTPTSANHLQPQPQPHPTSTSTSSSSKPWFVVATKADLPGTQQNFQSLRQYLARVSAGAEEHPAGPEGSPAGPEGFPEGSPMGVKRWRGGSGGSGEGGREGGGGLKAVAVSGIRGEGVERIPALAVSLLGIEK